MATVIANQNINFDLTHEELEKPLLYKKLSLMSFNYSRLFPKVNEEC